MKKMVEGKLHVLAVCPFSLEYGWIGVFDFEGHFNCMILLI